MDVKENMEENIEVEEEKTFDEENDDQEKDTVEEVETSILELQAKYASKEKEAEEYLNLLRRGMADFDNYKKRTNKEREGLYDEGFYSAVKEMLPVLDNLERAQENSGEEAGSLFEGVKLVIKMFKEILSKSGVEEIISEGEEFNPDYHNAIMHVEDDSVGESIIIEVLQKGYMYKGKVIRHSMVKVAN